MFREMRRNAQQLTTAACEKVLERATSGVLAVSGDNGYPYAVPVSFVYVNGILYVHGAAEGHKLDAIARESKVSFCVVDRDDVKPEAYTTSYRSVIAFGRARMVKDPAEKHTAMEQLTAKYNPAASAQERHEKMEGILDRIGVVAVEIEHLTGKEK